MKFIFHSIQLIPQNDLWGGLSFRCIDVFSFIPLTYRSIVLVFMKSLGLCLLFCYSGESSDNKTHSMIYSRVNIRTTNTYWRALKSEVLLLRVDYANTLLQFSKSYVGLPAFYIGIYAERRYST